jgi:hypothetical protein
MHRILIISGLAVTALAAGLQPAAAAPFCLQSTANQGMPMCSYHTWEQCMASRNGGADNCNLNHNGRYAFDLRDPAHPRAVSPAPRRIREYR